MGARQKLNETYLIGIAVTSVAAGLIFASLDMAILLGVVLVAAMIAGGSIRLTPDMPPHRPARRSRRRR